MSLELWRYREGSVGSKVPNVLHRGEGPIAILYLMLLACGTWYWYPMAPVPAWNQRLEPDPDPDPGIYRFAFPCEICTKINTVVLQSLQRQKEKKNHSGFALEGDHWDWSESK